MEVHPLPRVAVATVKSWFSGLFMLSYDVLLTPSFLYDLDYVHSDLLSIDKQWWVSFYKASSSPFDCLFFFSLQASDKLFKRWPLDKSNILN